MSKIVEKKIIDSCWELSKRSWEDEKAVERDERI